MKTIRGMALVGMVAVLAACSGQGATSAPAATATAAPSQPSGLTELPVIAEGNPQPLAAGSYVTGNTGFFPGLQITIPAGWKAGETDSGEISLRPDAAPDDVLLLWTNVVATVTNNRDGKVGQPLEGVGSSAKDLVTWLTTTSDFAVIEQPAPLTIGQGITGTVLTVGVSDTANFAEPDCPDNPKCASIFTDPNHWGPGFYAIGGAEVARIFVSPTVDPHTFLVVLDAPDATKLPALESLAAPILASLKLPAF